MIDACAELFDLARCHSWTESFTRWCDTQQELVLYRGHCFLHRAEMLELHGAWPEALVEARRACDRLAAPVNPAALGGACMIEGDLLRLVGDFDGAEAAYQRANEFGRDPQPSLALLRLAQGRIDVADAMIRRVVGETEDPMSRARMLGPYVEIVLAAGDTAAARTAADELRVLAAELATPYLRAHAARATRRGAPGRRQRRRRARRTAKSLQRVPRPRRALRSGTHPAPHRRRVRQRSATTTRPQWKRTPPVPCSTPSARPRPWERSPQPAASPPDGLTERELEVLVLLARGKTNRVIAQELFISEKTVASHVEPHLHQTRRHLAVRRHRLRLRPPSRLIAQTREGVSDVWDHHRCDR